ncbi:tetratricopeptide repeat protein [Flammeovirga pacifica]|uniref:Uncharacterized protein n=1 Tax=Flammeovirga pacifica TaxID=915059 RepID=A0A1S1YYE5_FLAPC|nr:tetratricopeptide repeat protein [Flammeovirga pacifica]OHX66029.1 hypothetical protein NH26_06510 [Flammeovirga pacifica]
MKAYYLLSSLLLLPIFSFSQVGYKEYYGISKEKAEYLIDSLSQYEHTTKEEKIEFGFNKSYLYKHSKQLDKAINEISELILFYPKDYDLYDLRSNYYQDNGQHNKAVQDLSIALLYAPDTAFLNLYVNRASAYSAQQKFQKAYDDLQKAIKIDSTDTGVLNNLGAISDELGRPEEAFIYFNKIIKLEPDFMPGYLNLGFKYQLIGEHEMAIEMFDKVIESDQYLGLSFNNRSYSKLKLGDIKGAFDDVSVSLYVDDSNSYAYRNLALIYIEMKDFDSACKAIEESINKGFIQRYGNEIIDLKNKYCEVSATQ